MHFILIDSNMSLLIFLVLLIVQEEFVFIGQVVVVLVAIRISVVLVPAAQSHSLISSAPTVVVRTNILTPISLLFTIFFLIS